MPSRRAEFLAGVFQPKTPVFESRRIADGMFVGPKGSFQRYSASPAASDVVMKPYSS